MVASAGSSGFSRAAAKAAATYLVAYRPAGRVGGAGGEDFVTGRQPDGVAGLAFVHVAGAGAGCLGRDVGLDLGFRHEGVFGARGEAFARSRAEPLVAFAGLCQRLTMRRADAEAILGVVHQS